MQTLKPKPIQGIPDVIDGINWREQAKYAISRGYVAWMSDQNRQHLPPDWKRHLRDIKWEGGSDGPRRVTFATAMAVIRDCANCFSHPACGAIVDLGRRFLEDDQSSPASLRGVTRKELQDALHKLREEIECA